MYEVPKSKYFLFLWILKRNLIIFFGGLSDNTHTDLTYDMTCKKLSIFIPHPIYNHSKYCQTKIGGETYILGDSTNIVQKYNPIDNNWTILHEHLPNLLKGFSVVSFRHKIYVIGGEEFFENPDGNIHYGNKTYISNFSEKIYSYDISSDTSVEGTWQEESFCLPEEKKLHDSVIFNGRIWVAGGFNNIRSDLTTVISFDISKYTSKNTSGWRTEPSLNEGRHDFRLLVVLGELYAVGNFSYSVSIEKLGTDNKWHVITFLLENYIMANAIVYENFIYLYREKKWNAYDVITNTWLSNSSPTTKRSINPSLVTWQNAIHL